MSELEDTIAALIPRWPGLAQEQRVAVIAACVSMVKQQLGLSSAHVRVGFRSLLLLYNCYLFIRSGRTPLPEERSGALVEFSSLPIPFVGSLERILRSTALLMYFDQPEVLHAMGEETIAERQIAFRARRIEELSRTELDAAGTTT